VTRKITNGVAKIALGEADLLTLGNLDISRDWGWAPDYVDGMISILNHSSPDDFILATGKSHTLKEFVATAFAAAGISDWEKFLQLDSSLSRPADVISVVGDATRARQILGWAPTTNFDVMIRAMVDFDLEIVEGGNSDKIWKVE
jgi:GDPmannose 4,6-dehydratase